MSWEALGGLPLTIDSVVYDRQAATFAYGFERITTLVRLVGGGLEGHGEDVSLHESDEHSLHVLDPDLGLVGAWSLESFCDHLASVDPFAVPPEWEPARRWRNWAFESAALDLALAQAGLPLHEALGRSPAPLRFVNSLGLGDPPTFDPIARRLEVHPELRFKLDVTHAWSPELMAEVAATGAVEIVDFKGHYGLETRRARARCSRCTSARSSCSRTRCSRTRTTSPRSPRCSRRRATASPTTRRSTPPPTSTRSRCARAR